MDENTVPAKQAKKLIFIFYYFVSVLLLSLLLRYKTFSPDTVKKMPKSDLVQEVTTISFSLGSSFALFVLI